MAALGRVNIEAINALAELERLGITWTSVGEDEVRLKCPAHEDETPSANLNVAKNLWKCHAAGCGKSGDFVSFLAYLAGVERSTVLVDLATRYDIGLVKTIDPQRVEEWHSRIWANEVLKKELYKRGLVDDDIRRYRLGVDQGRITIPVEDPQGRVINIRKYLPGAPGPKKMQNLKSYTGTALYPVKQIGFSSIVICGGEMKAVVAARLLNPHGIGALCVTAGEGAWDPSFTPLFKGKIVYVCMDVDTGGRVASRRVAAHVVWEAQSVRIVSLPLDIHQYPKGDINDWVAAGGTDQQLLKLLEESDRYIHERKEDDSVETEPSEATLSESTKSENVGRKIRVAAIVAAMDETPYLVPKTVSVSCTKDQPNCPYCPIKPLEPEEKTGKCVLTIKGTALGLLDMVNCPAKNQREGIRTALRIPPCKVAEFTVRDNYNVLDVRLTPQIHHSGDNTDHVVQAAYVVSTNGRAVELNGEYQFSGRVYPHPKNQQAVLLLDTIERSGDTLAAFAPEHKQLAPLLMFRPKEWTVAGIQEALDRRYADFETNTTRIFCRPDLHLAVDLTMHSVLYYVFDDRQQNGWINGLVLGDSSQGKSETTLRLMEHYGLGVRFDCKNATVAGLLGGIQELGKRSFISWGVVTLNDRRFVALEEIKGTSIEVLGGLTDMRSSGIAELVKIERRKAHARTRILMLSNPRSDRPVAFYGFGCETIKELMGSMEDIRRFDFALILSVSQVDSRAVNQLVKAKAEVPHRYTKELCRLCVLWAWTRQASEVAFDEGVEQDVINASNELCDKFTEDLPLVDRGTMRHKLAKLSISLAALTFSTRPNDPSTILVRKGHVEFIRNWLVKIYSDPVFGYADFTESRRFSARLIDPLVVRRTILDTKHPNDLVSHLIHQEEVLLMDVCDWCAVDREEAQKILSAFVRKHALTRSRTGYHKTADFITMLKQMQHEMLKSTLPAVKAEF